MFKELKIGTIIENTFVGIIIGAFLIDACFLAIPAWAGGIAGGIIGLLHGLTRGGKSF